MLDEIIEYINKSFSWELSPIVLVSCKCSSSEFDITTVTERVCPGLAIATCLIANGSLATSTVPQVSLPDDVLSLRAAISKESDS